MTSGPPTLPRLLAGLAQFDMTGLAAHQRVHGELPELMRYGPADLIAVVEQSGLVGRGGAAFPVARKLRAVAAGRGARMVVANGAEGEPTSEKDHVLMRELPHLVLDGIAVAARAVGAQRAVVAVAERDGHALRSLNSALDERGRDRSRNQPRIAVATVGERYVAGQDTALVAALSGREGKPTFGLKPYQRGVNRAPTLVQNVETLAHLALIARHGAAWFRALGADAEPGSTLVTVSGAVSAPGVYEVERGASLADLLADVGARRDLRAVLIGGYGGAWIDAGSISTLRLSDAALGGRGAGVGAGVVVALPRGACPVAETCRVADYLAAESCGQCGPCLHGLAAIAAALQRLASGTADVRDTCDLWRWLGHVRDRGACGHPDGAAAFIESGLRVFEAEFSEHARRGPCRMCAGAGVLPVPLTTYAAAGR